MAPLRPRPNLRNEANFSDTVNAELVAEIWSPGNSKRDRADKFDAYAQAGIRYFWTAAPMTIAAAPVPITLDPADLLIP